MNGYPKRLRQKKGTLWRVPLARNGQIVQPIALSAPIAKETRERIQGVRPDPVALPARPVLLFIMSPKAFCLKFVTPLVPKRRK